MPVLTLFRVDNAKTIPISYETGQETLGWFRWLAKKRIAALAPDGRCPSYVRLILDGQELGSGDDSKPLDYFTISTSNWFAHPVFALEGYNKIQLMIKTLDDRTIIIAISPRETVDSLKRAIQKREGVLGQDQRLLFGDKQLEDGHMLIEYNIQKNSTLFMVSRLLGGSVNQAIKCVEFADMENESGLCMLQLTSSGPTWWTVTNGLNFQGTCTNRTCTAYNQCVVIPWGERSFDFTYDEGECSCPMCQEYVRPVTCGFVKTWWRFWGVKESKPKPKTIESNWKSVGNEYQYFDEKKSGVAEWRRLKILISKVDLSEYCPICEATLRDAVKYKCGHGFHQACIKSWKDEVVDIEMVNSCPTCNKK